LLYLKSSETFGLILGSDAAALDDDDDDDEATEK
jgi:hypothetical protein